MIVIPPSAELRSWSLNTLFKQDVTQGLTNKDVIPELLEQRNGYVPSNTPNKKKKAT